MDFHLQKTESLLGRLVGEFLSQEAGPQSLVTVTRVSFNEKSKHATVYLSVLPETQEVAALAFVKRQSSNLREYVRARAKLRILPVFEFLIDIGEKNRQRLEEISAEDTANKEDLNKSSN
jgi:ribosome-binding factor A